MVLKVHDSMSTAEITESVTMSGLRTYRNFNLKDTPSLASKVAVVTGGSDGIGKEIVAQLLLHGIEKVYVLSRNKRSLTRQKYTGRKSMAWMLKEQWNSYHVI